VRLDACFAPCDTIVFCLAAWHVQQCSCSAIVALTPCIQVACFLENGAVKSCRGFPGPFSGYHFCHEFWPPHRAACFQLSLGDERSATYVGQCSSSTSRTRRRTLLGACQSFASRCCCDPFECVVTARDACLTCPHRKGFVTAGGLRLYAGKETILLLHGCRNPSCLTYVVCALFNVRRDSRGRRVHQVVSRSPTVHAFSFCTVAVIRLVSRMSFD
jgi:hypothetical protein